MEIVGGTKSPGLGSKPQAVWFRELVSEGDAGVMEHSGKLVLLFEILQMAEDLQDKV